MTASERTQVDTMDVSPWCLSDSVASYKPHQHAIRGRTQFSAEINNPAYQAAATFGKKASERDLIILEGP
jgi:hypothetical protein